MITQVTLVSTLLALPVLKLGVLALMCTGHLAVLSLLSIQTFGLMLKFCGVLGQFHAVRTGDGKQTQAFEKGIASQALLRQGDARLHRLPGRFTQALRLQAHLLRLCMEVVGRP